jgi:hypothetical protein
MMGLLDFLLSGRADFYPFEMRIIDAVKSRLDDDAATRLQRQIEVINKIQRLADGKEVNLYQMRGGKAVFDDERRFPDAADEALLASVNLTGPDERANLKAEVWLAKGRLFSLVFNKPPKQFFAGMNLTVAQPPITDVKIWFDPMHPHVPSADKSVDASALRGWLREWHAKGLVADLHAPLPPAECAARIARIDAQLPTDYLELVAQTEGARLAASVVYGVAETRQVVWPEANYYIMAEIEWIGALAVKEGDRNAEIYLLRYDENNVRPVGTSLQKALTDLSSPVAQ